MGRPIGEKRSFVVQWPAAAAGGRFVAATPYGAARKACHRLIPQDSQEAVISFVLRETTQDSLHRHQLYGYSGSQKLNERKVVLGDRTITMRRDIAVRSLSQKDVDALLKPA